MFKMEDILDGRKMFKREGVGISTNGVSASVHFIFHPADATALLLAQAYPDVIS